MKSLYDVLGVPADASQDEIREAYARSENSMPDGSSQAREAYEILSDPERRASYDAARASLNAVPAAAEAEAAPEAPVKRKRLRNPLDRLTAGMSRPWRIAVDWIVTIIGAVLIVLAIKAWVVNPYRIPSSSMEPTLHCAKPGQGCEARLSDRVLANRFIYHFRSPHRGEIVVFNTPPLAEARCGAGGTFVKRLIGLPGDTVSYNGGVLRVDGKRINEPYVKPGRAGGETGNWHVPKGSYFMMGDNRRESCDSRVWGSVPRKNLIGPVFATYWPPNRISFR